MGAVIRAATTAQPGRWPLTHGARRLADAAAQSCLRQAGATPADLDLLVNVGVFRERGLGEPALAALIQEDIGATDRTGTFSFDLDDAACGVLTAADVIRGFLTSGAARLGMVVASDSGPDPLHTRHVPHTEYGGALLLGWDETVPGLVLHRSRTFPEFEGLAQSVWSWQDGGHLRAPSPTGRNTLLVKEKPGYHARAADCAVEVVREVLAEQRLTAADLDLLVATHGPGFADEVADRIGLPHGRVAHVAEDAATAHTAEPVAAIATAMRQGRWQTARTVLLVAAGAGISVGVSLYQQ
jgi:3-oxoacyl-[acyl-carrier-protein] synthase-3